MVAFVAIISIASCKKEINYNDPNGNNCKLTRLTLDLPLFGSFNLVLSYDASGRLIKAESENDIANYTYAANKITSTNQDGIVSEITLSNGRAVSSSTPDYIQINGVSYAITRKYTYNSEGYLATVKNYIDGVLNSTDVITYTDGNLTKSVVKYESDGSMETTVYEYSTQLAVNTYEMADPLSFHVDYFPGKYYGIQSKNVLIRSTTLVTDASTDLIGKTITTYKYQFDTKGNATFIISDSRIIGYRSGSVISTDDYSISSKLTYDCK